MVARLCGSRPSTRTPPEPCSTSAGFEAFIHSPLTVGAGRRGSRGSIAPQARRERAWGRLRARRPSRVRRSLSHVGPKYRLASAVAASSVRDARHHECHQCCQNR
jgi:hypothetical protein